MVWGEGGGESITCSVPCSMPWSTSFCLILSSPSLLKKESYIRFHELKELSKDLHYTVLYADFLQIWQDFHLADLTINMYVSSMFRPRPQHFVFENKI